jgi:ribosomal protein S18 acetylase RimI-like enzyme
VVDTPFRRNGIGTQLLQHLETYLVETMGAQVMVAYARYGDSAAQAFLTRNAYLIAGTEADHHEMVDAWIYRKTLCDHRLAALSKSPA